MGIKKEDLKFAGELKFVEMAPALCDNKIDAFTFVAGHPNAIFQEAASSCATSIASITGPGVDKLVKDNPFYAKANIPGKMYKGTDNPQPTFGVLATIVASADLPEQTAYIITKAVFDNLASDEPKNRAQMSCGDDWSIAKAALRVSVMTYSRCEYTMPAGRKANATCCVTCEITNTRSSPTLAA